jgi:hypothetical protein
MSKGGAFLAEGADTCVYDPPVACAIKSKEPADMRVPGKYISRVTDTVTQDGDERVNQKIVKDAIHEIQLKYPDKEIEKFFNLAVAVCTPRFVMDDIFRGPRFEGDQPTSCGAQEVEPDVGINKDKVNFITLRQEEDLNRNKHTKPETLSALRKLFHAVAYLNDENVVHTDAHFGNIAWMGDRLVMHDWGRAIVGADGFRKFIDRWELLKPVERKRMSQYDQFRGPCDLLDTCPVNLADDDSSHRFMKIYDTASMAAGLARFNLAKKSDADFFGKSLEALWHNPKVVTSDMSPILHTLIDKLFDKIEANVSAPASEPVPVPDISADKPWDVYFRENKYKKVAMTPGEVEIVATIVGEEKGWAVFAIDSSTEAVLLEEGVPNVSPRPDALDAGIVLSSPAKTDPRKRPQLGIPIRFFNDGAVVLKDAPASPLSFGGGRRLTQTQRFCKCIKKVRRTVRNQKGPIAICVKSVLQKKGRTLKRFTCGKKGRVITQKAKVL